MSEPIELRNLKDRTSPPSYPPPPTRSARPNGEPSSTGPAGSLGKAYRLAEEKAKAAVHLHEGGMDNIAFWGCGAAVWFTLLSLPLLLFPRILLFFSQIAPISHLSSTDAKNVASSAYDREHYDTLTPLESFLCRCLASGLISMALIILFTLVPRYDEHSNPARRPLLNVLVGLSTLMSVVAYNTRTIGALGVVTGLGNGVVAIWGWWVIVFGNIKLEQRESKVPKRLRKL